MSAPGLRFKVGSRVQCNLGRQGWASGTVVALHYHEEDWPEGKTVPYQVQLDKKYDSALIYAPADLSNLIRADTDPLPGTPSLPKQQVRCGSHRDVIPVCLYTFSLAQMCV